MQISSVNQSTIFKTAGRATIGKSEFNILDYTFKIKEAASKPGPGTYKKFSDFNNTLD